MVLAHHESKSEAAAVARAAPSSVPLVLRLPSDWELTNERLLELCSLNETVPFEVDETGALILSVPSGPTSEWMGYEVGWQLRSWADVDSGDLVVGSSALFQLSDGNRRSPDIAWISAARLQGVDIFDGEIWQVAPDFIVEIRSRSDEVDRLQEKMEMWLRNGVRLGWLVDPFGQRLWVYRAGGEVEEFERPEQMSDEAVLPSLVVDLRRIWRSA